MKKKKENIFSNKALISGFIAFIMVTSILGYMWGINEGNSFKYNGYTFVRQNNFWTAKINGVSYEFNYFPSDVEDLEFDSGMLARLVSAAEIDSTSFVNDTNNQAIALSQFNIKNAIEKQDIFFRTGFTTSNKYNLSVISCEDSTALVPVIYFKTSNITMITIEDNCIVSEAKNAQDFLKIKDRILFGILGVI